MRSFDVMFIPYLLRSSRRLTQRSCR